MKLTSVISQVALRVVNDVLNGDRLGHIDTVVSNGMVTTIDATTGHLIRPCVLTLRTTREAFSELDLARVDSEGLNGFCRFAAAEALCVR